jgi:putative endonuclease
MGSPSGILYTGVTNNLQRRVAEHKSGQVPGFTRRYRVNRLLYFAEFRSIRNAIEHETRVKSWTRRKRLDLIRTINPKFEDLSEEPTE